MKLSDIKEGQVINLDAGFTCAKKGPVVVEKDDKGRLYFPCDQGHHLLDGQVDHDNNGELIGITK